MSAHPPFVETLEKTRVLDAVIRKTIPLGKATDLVVMIRKTDADGLKALLEISNYSASKDDIVSKNITLEFPKNGMEPVSLKVKVVAPDFRIEEAVKPITVPPEKDSEEICFMLTPIRTGELIISLGVLYCDDPVVEGLLRTNVIDSDSVDGKYVLISMPIAVCVKDATLAEDAKRIFEHADPLVLEAVVVFHSLFHKIPAPSGIGPQPLEYNTVFVSVKFEPTSPFRLLDRSESQIRTLIDVHASTEAHWYVAIVFDNNRQPVFVSEKAKRLRPAREFQEKLDLPEDVATIWTAIGSRDDVEQAKAMVVILKKPAKPFGQTLYWAVYGPGRDNTEDGVK